LGGVVRWCGIGRAGFAVIRVIDSTGMVSFFKRQLPVARVAERGIPAVPAGAEKTTAHRYIDVETIP
jgi:hypothetical protein